MAAIDDLISQSPDEALRARMAAELERMGNAGRFGLVFENSLSKLAPLHGRKITPGRTAARKSGPASELFRALRVDGNEAVRLGRQGGEACSLALAELAAMAEFGEPIHPYLERIDSITKAPDSDLWHILMESDNYHAPQLLDHLCLGKADCIYIDPLYSAVASEGLEDAFAQFRSDYTPIGAEQ